MRRVLINVEDRELRVAILEDEQLLELYIESLEDKSILNNIYKGRIEGILPGLKAAFVNVGLERNAFLHFDDVRPDMLWQRYKQDHPDAETPGLASLDAEDETELIEDADDAEEMVAAAELAEVAADDAEGAQAETSGEDEDDDEAGGRRRRRRGRRGGKRRKRDVDQPFDPVRDEVLDADIDSGDDDDEDEEEEVSQPPLAAAQVHPPEPTDDEDADPEVAAAAPSESEGVSRDRQEERRNARTERQRRRRERWEQKKLERKMRRLEGGGQPVAGGQNQPQPQQQQPQRQIKPHPTTTAAANAWVPPAMRGAPGTRGAANPYDVFSPYNQPQPAKRQWGRRGATGDDWGNQRTAPRRNDNRESQEDFFGPAPRQRQPVYDDDQPFAYGAQTGQREYYDDEDYGDAPAPGNEKFPTAQRTGPPRNQQNNNRRMPNKRRGGRNRTMKKRNPSYYAARAKKGADAEGPDVAVEATAKKKPSPRSKKAEPAGEAAPKATASRTKSVKAAEPTPKMLTAEKKPASRSRKKAEAATAKQTSSVDTTSAAPKKGIRKKVEEPAATSPATASVAEVAEKKASRSRKKTADAPAENTAPAEAPAPRAEDTKEGPARKPARGRGRRGGATKASTGASSESPAAQAAEVASAVLDANAGSGVAVPTEPGQETTREGRDRSRRRGRRGGRGRGAREEAAGSPKGTPGQAQPETAGDESGQTAVTITESAPQPRDKPSRDDRRKGRDRGRDRKDREPQPRRWKRPPLFTETFKKGDEIMVQVIKEEIGLKGARISTYISMPGRYLVLLPYPNEEGGISRKVDDVAERKRLKQLLKDISSEEMAFIIRTAGIYRDEADIRSDVEFLTQEWKQIEERAKQTEVGKVVYDDHDIIYRLARDVFDDNIGEVLIDSHVEADKLRGVLNKLIPSLVDKVKVYSGPENIFHKFGVEKQIQKAARRKVWLKSGGYLIIDEAEALTAIDVNTGKSVGKDDQEKLILKTNLEAARAVARELKLRDIGGLIVIDFIDMKDTRNRDQVVNELKTALRKDRSKTSVSTISEFGLVEMTRKRVRRSLRKTLFMDCPYCQGAGVVLNEQQIWLHLKHEIVRQLEASRPAPSLNITVNSKIRAYLDQNYRETVRKLEQKYDTEIRFTMSDVFHMENYAIEKVGGSNVPASMSAASGGR